MRTFRTSAVMILGGFIVTAGVVTMSHGAAKSGETLFKEHCAVCHPDGGNIVNPKKTLHKKDRDANNVKTEADIVKLMRSPGPGMTKYDQKTISDTEAKDIAKFIIKTFK